MQIRTRLTLQFLLIGGIIMIISSAAIYFSSARFREDDFYNRLRDKARTTAKLLLDADESAPGKIKNAGTDYPVDLLNEKIIILDFLNDTIYNTDKEGEIEIRNDILERVRLYERINYRQGKFDVLGTLYANTSSRFVVIAAAIDFEGQKHLRKLRIILLFVCLISFALFVIAGWIFSGKALKPISEVINRVEDISMSSINMRVPEGNGTDEIGRLAKTFNEMLDRLETSFKVQKAFIANASHELRTPLTSINGQIEVLLLKERSASEYKTALESVLEDIRSLTDMTNKLLLIARTGSGKSLVFNDKVRIDEILWQIRDEMKKSREHFTIKISIGDSLTDSEQMVVRGDENLLKIAFSNIIDNACKFSPDHSVEVKLEYSGESVRILFTDTGIGISAGDLGKIFEPFYRGVNALQVQGSDIGLTLVTQILSNHGGTIRIDSKPERGTTVIVTLPVLSA